MQIDQFNQQHQNNDTFDRLSLVNGHCIIQNEKHPDARIFCKDAFAENSQPYREIVSCFRLLAKDKNPQPYITQKDFMTSNNYPEGNQGFKLFVFDFHHHQDFSSAQPIKVSFDLRPAVPAGTNLIGYALLSTNKLVSVSSDGQMQFDLV